MTWVGWISVHMSLGDVLVAQNEESFRREISILGPLHHPNIVELVGYARDPSSGALWLM